MADIKSVTGCSVSESQKQVEFISIQNSQKKGEEKNNVNPQFKKLHDCWTTRDRFQPDCQPVDGKGQKG